MTLIITAIIAIAFTVIKFCAPAFAAKYHVGAAALMFWGAALMWCSDGIFSVLEGESFIELADTAAMADDALLGVYVAALGLCAWGVINLVNHTKRTGATARES